MTSLPTFIDADTGFGEPMNAARTIQILEEAGVAGCRRYRGSGEPQAVWSSREQVGRADRRHGATDSSCGSGAPRRRFRRLRLGTDARSVEGLDAAMERARAYVDAGADLIFPEALLDESEFADFRRAIDVPILANMTEFGQGRLLRLRRSQISG